jgi:hypothetical protein
VSQYSDFLTVPVTGPTRQRGARTLTRSMIERTIRQATIGLPRKVGNGPGVFVPTTSIERQPIRWDTNCFYRRLGLTPDATRLDIVRRFLELDPQQSFIRLAYAAQVLIDKESRQRYDALSLGCFWAQDPDLVEAVLGGGLGDVSDQWGVYADSTVTDEQARSLSPEWRTMMCTELTPRFSKYAHPPLVGVGATDREANVRWEQIGMFAVLFVRFDSEPTPEYLHDAAEELMGIATPVEV